MVSTSPAVQPPRAPAPLGVVVGAFRQPTEGETHNSIALKRTSTKYDLNDIAGGGRSREDPIWPTVHKAASTFYLPLVDEMNGEQRQLQKHQQQMQPSSLFASRVLRAGTWRKSYRIVSGNNHNNKPSAFVAMARSEQPHDDRDEDSRNATNPRSADGSRVEGAQAITVDASASASASDSAELPSTERASNSSDQLRASFPLMTSSPPQGTTTNCSSLDDIGPQTGMHPHGLTLSQSLQIQSLPSRQQEQQQHEQQVALQQQHSRKSKPRIFRVSVVQQASTNTPKTVAVIDHLRDDLSSTSSMDKNNGIVGGECTSSFSPSSSSSFSSVPHEHKHHTVQSFESSVNFADQLAEPRPALQNSSRPPLPRRVTSPLMSTKTPTDVMSRLSAGGNNPWHNLAKGAKFTRKMNCLSGDCRGDDSGNGVRFDSGQWTRIASSDVRTNITVVNTAPNILGSVGSVGDDVTSIGSSNSIITDCSEVTVLMSNASSARTNSTRIPNHPLGRNGSMPSAGTFIDASSFASTSFQNVRSPRPLLDRRGSIMRMGAFVGAPKSAFLSYLETASSTANSGGGLPTSNTDIGIDRDNIANDDTATNGGGVGGLDGIIARTFPFAMTADDIRYFHDGFVTLVRDHLDRMKARRKQ